MKSKEFWIFIGILLFVSCAILATGLADKVEIESVSLLGIVIMLYIYASWASLYHRTLSPYIVFVSCLYLCLCGQSVMWAFGLDAGWRDLRENLPHGMNESYIGSSLVYSYLCIIVLHLTVIGGVLRNGHYRGLELFRRYRSVNVLPNVERFGWFLGLVSVIPYIYVSSIQMAVISTVGYAAQYESSNAVPSWLAQFSEYFGVSLIMLLYSTYGRNKSKVHRYVVYGLVVLYLYNELQLGQRTPLILFLMAILFIVFRRKTIKSRQMVVGLILIFVGMTFMRFITLVRDGTINGYADFSAYFADSDNIPAVDFLGDIGWNLFSLVQSMQLIPSRFEYADGTSYLISLTSIIPNLGFWDVHPAALYGALGDWLQKVLGISYGPGFTPVAESYYNFGWLGIFVFILWGKFCVLLNNLYEEDRNEVSSLFLILIVGVVLKSAVRSSFLAFFKPFVFMCILPLLAIAVISKTRVRQ